MQDMSDIGRTPPSCGLGMNTTRDFVHSSGKMPIWNNSSKISVKLTQRKPPIEQVGVYDPLPNVYNEKLVSFNYERIQYWLARRAQVSKPVADLLGLAGYLPVHPRTYMRAWRNRKAVKEGITKDNVHQEEAIVSTN
ncbi:probable 28S ribosomal protein S16, mitochondrial isoform X3 [Solenopsis invicta]|uniref:probable 28S ribosomal protein S16, mitochondrial isoform X3 n=1 Tax=Solenopsis invicta TaxID=13686 RepID=UPI00193CB921|nr:probable 28S ribosomal protein S16, mitochondrial isoform X3 [Solenopsis invicta]